MIFDRCHIKNRKIAFKQHIKYFYFRCKIKLDHLVEKESASRISIYDWISDWHWHGTPQASNALIMTETVPVVCTFPSLVFCLVSVAIGSLSSSSTAELLVETWFLAICHRQHTTVSPSEKEEEEEEDGKALHWWRSPISPYSLFPSSSVM